MQLAIPGIRLMLHAYLLPLPLFRLLFHLLLRPFFFFTYSCPYLFVPFLSTSINSHQTNPQFASPHHQYTDDNPVNLRPSFLSITVSLPQALYRHQAMQNDT
jgi:hypothetical protein